MRSVVVACVLLIPAVAHADEPGMPAAPTAAAPDASVMAGETEAMPAKRGMLHAMVEINLSKDAAFKPFGIAPDIWYGVSDKLTLGLVHSTLGATGFMGGVGDSLCFTGSDNGCDGAYSDVGLDVRYQFARGKFSAAFDGGLFVQDFDPFQLDLKIGITGRYRPSPASKVAIDLSPSLFFRFTNRADMGGANDVFGLPITLLYSISPKLALALQTGLVLPFQSTGDLYSVPLTFGVNYQINKKFSIDAAFALLQLLGGSALATGADVRTFTIGVGYAF